MLLRENGECNVARQRVGWGYDLNLTRSRSGWNGSTNISGRDHAECSRGAIESDAGRTGQVVAEDDDGVSGFARRLHRLHKRSQTQRDAEDGASAVGPPFDVVP